MKNLLERFSCSLIGRGKKVSGHKILLESLLMLREKNDKVLLSPALQKNHLKIEDFHHKYKNNEFKKAQRRKNFQLVKADPTISDQLNRNLQLTKKSKFVSNVSTKKSDKTQLAEYFAYNKNTKLFTENKKLSFIGTLFTDSVFAKFSQEKRKKSSFENVRNKNKEKQILNNNKICQLCIDNVKPVLETRKVRKGRLTYRVPKITELRRQEGKAIGLLIDNARSHKNSESKHLSAISSKSINNDPSLIDIKKIVKTNDLTDVKKSIVDRKVKSSPNQKFAKATQFDSLKGKTLVSTVSSFNSFQRKTSNRNNVDLTLFYEQPSIFQKKSKLTSIKSCLSEELFNAFNETGPAVEKKKQLHNFALQNRANLHFRWW